MEKMKMESPDLVAQNIEKIAELFPSCITETEGTDGKPKRAINFEVLKQALSSDVLDGPEAYEFTWVGKKAAEVEAYRPIRNTLRPCVEESVDWDTTENLYIEGDNLEVLKLMQGGYSGKVKLIYIDPPYNTGNDFIYRDNFAMSAEEYAEASGQYDEEGNRLFRNTNVNGRFHSDWCSMIYSRLLLARNLLSDDGVIFISIDDHEQENLKKIAGEVFGGSNFLAQIVWERAYAPVNLKKHFSPSHDYILCYAKNIDKAVCNGIPRTDEANERYTNPDNDPRGVWQSDNLSVGPAVAENIYPIKTPSGDIIYPTAGRSWVFSREVFQQKLEENRIWFGENGDSVPRLKRFLSELRRDGMVPMTLWKQPQEEDAQDTEEEEKKRKTIWEYKDVGHSQDATKALKELFDGKKYFDYPKPVDLIKRCISLYSDENSIVLDFFSGSATTAHAVMQLNAEDGGHRKFIMVQFKEKFSEDSEAYNEGYKNICDFGRERIRRAGNKIKEENPEAPDLDTGFRVLKLDESNMKDVYYGVDEYNQEMLPAVESNIKEDRDELDLLFGCLIDLGIPLSNPYVSEEIDGVNVHTYNYTDGKLIACFDENIPESVIEKIAKKKPKLAVFRDSSFADSPAKINAGEKFKMFSIDTSVKVL